MSYFDVYLSRVNHLGNTTAERIINSGIRSFNKWMAESPHTVRKLSVERGIYFDGIILTSKDKQYEKIMFLNVGNEVPLQVGDIMTWPLDDGGEEKWILAQEEKKTHGTYKTYWIIRCNYLLKWIDGNGHLQQSWSYTVSSVDSKIKGNYRTWNSLITPQPNKYAEILMPRYPINRSTNFIIEDESWSVIEYDHTSVPGTIYLSLTENKINMIYDDLVNKVADTDKLANYKLLVPSEPQQFVINEPFTPNFTLMKNGVQMIDVDTEILLLPKQNSNIESIPGESLKLVGRAAGMAEIIVQLKKYPQIVQTLQVEITDTVTSISGYIEGPEKIRLGKIATFVFKSTAESIPEVTFVINDNSFAKIISIAPNSCEVKANVDNILGSFILTAVYNGVSYEKEIQIIPLW